MADLITLPTDPRPAVETMLDWYRKSREVDGFELAHCGIHLQGVTLGYVHTHPPVLTKGTKPPAVIMEMPTTDEAKIELLERASAVLKGTVGSAIDAAAIPWAMLAQIAFDLFMKWLRERQPA